VRPERPQRVLVGPQLAQVEPIPVEVEEVAEVAGVGDRLELLEAGVVLEQVADHQHAPGGARGGGDLLGRRERLGERLLHEAVLPCGEYPQCHLGVRGHRRRADHGVQLGVGEQLVELGAHADARQLGCSALARRLRAVAEPAQLGVGQAVEVARQVRAPVTEAHDPDTDRGAAGHAASHRAAVYEARRSRTRSPARPPP
jgi:hypothetical protein